MRPTTDATPTCTTTAPTPCTAEARSRDSRIGPRMGTALSIGVGAAAVGALLAPAVGSQPTTSVALETTSAIAPSTLTVADREAAAQRSASRSSRSAERGAAAATAIPAALAAPELEKAGTRYTTTALKVRLRPNEDADVQTVLKPGAKVTITEVSDSGFQQIIHKGDPRWVKREYLSKSKPRPKPASRSASGSASGSAGISGGACASGSGVERGLQANTIAVHRAVCNAFPSVTSYGGLRGGGGNHGAGRALDIMVTGSTGDAIAQYLRANAGRLGITEIIWEQRIWTTQRAGEGWRWMSDRGSATANHYDHVHVSTR